MSHENLNPERPPMTYTPQTGQGASQERAHKLKTDPEVFEAVRSGAKTFEIRFNDRDFQVGDRLELHETAYTGAEMKAGQPLLYTGRAEVRYVSHVLTGYGLMDGWCCLSFAAAPQALSVGAVPWIERVIKTVEFIAHLARIDNDEAIPQAMLDLRKLLAASPPPAAPAVPEPPLADDELAGVIVSALAQANAPDAVWRALTFDHGPYDITAPRAEVVQVARAVEAAVVLRLRGAA